MSSAAFEVNQVMRTVRRSISLENLALPDEFYPAHLSVALIDAVFNPQGDRDGRTIPAAERYCQRFGIARTRASRWDQPPAEDQETLTDLIRGYSELGMDRMVGEVFRTGAPLPGSSLARAEFVLRAAKGLTQLGVGTLQDVGSRPREDIERTLGDSVGLGESAIRSFLMYTGGDDFVRGDGHIRRFVADALGRREISAAKAESLVRRSAYELILSPRYLDHRIWSHRSAWPKAA